MLCVPSWEEKRNAGLLGKEFSGVITYQITCAFYIVRTSQNEASVIAIVLMLADDLLHHLLMANSRLC